MRFSKSVLHSKTTQAYEAYSDDYDASNKGYCFQLSRSPDEQNKDRDWLLEVINSQGNREHEQRFKLKREAAEYAQNFVKTYTPSV